MLAAWLVVGFSTHAESVEASAPRVAFEHTVERRPVLMGTLARLIVEAPTRDEALATTVEIERILRSAEDALSTWKPGTELDRLHRTAPGQAVALAPEVDRELVEALECAAATDGAFDPTLGALIQAWDLRGEGRHPDESELTEARSRTGWRWLARQQGSWVRQRDLMVDEGGFGKGAALDRVARWLADQPPRRILVDLGGQLLFSDPRVDPEPFPITVASPDDRFQPLLRLTLPAGSVATSGNSERGQASGLEVLGHLLDPRTGRAAVDFGSLTVWARSGLRADCLATGLFVAGPEAALAYAARHDDVEVLVVERQPQGLVARSSSGLLSHIHWTAPELSGPLRTGSASPAVRPSSTSAQSWRAAPNPEPQAHRSARPLESQKPLGIQQGGDP